MLSSSCCNEFRIMEIELAKDLRGLRIQANAMKTLIKCQERIMSNLYKKDYSLAERRLEALEADLESEREMNATLTEEIIELEKARIDNQA